MRLRGILLAAALVTVTAPQAVGPAGAGPAADLPANVGSHLADELARGADHDVRVLVRVDGDAAAYEDVAEVRGLDVSYAFDAVPVLAGTIDADRVPRLAEEPWAVEVSKDRQVEVEMDVSRVEVLAPNAEAEGLTGQGVNVAILDTGIDKTHPAFEDRIDACVKFELGVKYPTCDDENGHGTHVAGTVGAEATTTAPEIRGVAPDVTYSIVKVLNAVGVGLTSDVMAGMQWVIDNRDTYDIRIMSMSLGGSECGDGTSDESQLVDEVMANNILPVIAAGNSGPDSCTVTIPGDAEGALTVGAVDDWETKNHGDDAIADFSSRGPTKDGRIKPEVVAPGVGITSTYPPSTYATLDGTSMATPHVSGVAALLFEQDPDLSSQQAKDAVVDTAKDLAADPDATPNNNYGYGFVGTCDLLDLSDCSQPADLTPVSAASVSTSWEHFGQDKHRVFTTVSVEDDDGSAVGGADVQTTTTAPDGTVLNATAKTDDAGDATTKVQKKDGGHGDWESCVATVYGAGIVYDEAANTETCETLTISH